ncbi:MAG TPA: 50S ribosomal protein L25 [Candidatus Baltobacteraceae bacterium]|jgi:large subunit ribosomal protein L25|nr:50S ribosomal protein L25 [Candidatus Baltobacteraceae bacterium]
MAMEAIKLALKKRDGSVRAKKLRQRSMIPAVIYGHGTENKNVMVDYNSFNKAFKAAGESTLLDLEIEGDGTVKALVKDWQVEPLSNRYAHVDFYQVNLKEKLKTEIALNFIGESPAVKEQGGSIIKTLDSILVECLPTDLVHSIDVDVSTLKNFDDMIAVKDLVIPEGIHVLENPDETIVKIEAPMTEDQLKALENAAPVDVTAVKTEAEVKAAEEAAKAAAEEAPAKE